LTPKGRHHQPAAHPAARPGRQQHSRLPLLPHRRRDLRRFGCACRRQPRPGRVDGYRR
jgi:hypothetical protein